MKGSSVDLIDKDLAARLDTATEPQLRAAAFAAANFGMERAGLRDELVSEVLSALAHGQDMDEKLREKLARTVASLDNMQFALQNQVDEGRADKAAQSAAFRKARAADATYQASDPNAFKAATEAIYEARFASKDMEGLRSRVLAALKSGHAS